MVLDDSGLERELLRMTDAFTDLRLKLARIACSPEELANSYQRIAPRDMPGSGYLGPLGASESWEKTCLSFQVHHQDAALAVIERDDAKAYLVESADFAAKDRPEITIETGSPPDSTLLSVSFETY